MGSLHNFKFGASTGRFLSDGVASMALKGSKCRTAFILFPQEVMAFTCAYGEPPGFFGVFWQSC